MIRELCKTVNAHVREKGFWKSMHQSVAVLQDNASDSEIKATKDAFIAQKIALIGTELSEAVEAMRKPDYEANGYGLGVKDSFADELADTVIRIFDLCGELGIDLQAQIEWKIDYNTGRDKKHGKEF